MRPWWFTVAPESSAPLRVVGRRHRHLVALVADAEVVVRVVARTELERSTEPRPAEAQVAVVRNGWSPAAGVRGDRDQAARPMQDLDLHLDAADHLGHDLNPLPRRCARISVVVAMRLSASPARSRDKPDPGSGSPVLGWQLSGRERAEERPSPAVLGVSRRDHRGPLRLGDERTDIWRDRRYLGVALLVTLEACFAIPSEVVTLPAAGFI